MANILVVEDDPTLNDAYSLILKKAGHKVTSVYNGQGALDVVKDVKPKIILLDLLMPKLSGIQFLEIFDVKSKPKTTVIILSNIGDDNEVEKAMQLGAYKYIVKAHASPDELSTLVNHLIKKNLN